MTNQELNQQSLPICAALEKSFRETPNLWKRTSLHRVEREDGLWVEHNVPGENSSVFWIGTSGQWSPIICHDISAQMLGSIYMGGKVAALARTILGRPREDILVEVNALLGI
jgi:hypothetical protein